MLEWQYNNATKVVLLTLLSPQSGERNKIKPKSTP